MSRYGDDDDDDEEINNFEESFKKVAGGIIIKVGEIEIPVLVLPGDSRARMQARCRRGASLARLFELMLKIDLDNGEPITENASGVLVCLLIKTMGREGFERIYKDVLGGWFYFGHIAKIRRFGGENELNEPEKGIAFVPPEIVDILWEMDNFDFSDLMKAVSEKVHEAYSKEEESIEDILIKLKNMISDDKDDDDDKGEDKRPSIRRWTKDTD